MVGLTTPVRVLVAGLLGADDVEELLEGDVLGSHGSIGALLEGLDDRLALLESLADLLDVAGERT